jgi:hypothetical protein
VSSVLVVGGSGDYFAAADNIIIMELAIATRQQLFFVDVNGMWSHAGLFLLLSKARHRLEDGRRNPV